MMQEYVYPQTELGRDYARAVIGLSICAAPFFWVDPAIFIVVILAAMAAVFGVLLWQTTMRHITRFDIDEHGITMIAVRRRTIPWAELRRVQLSYFTTWKNLAGFMELKLVGVHGSMRIGSGLLGFRNVVIAAVEAAKRNRLDFKAATIENLRHLNIADPRIDVTDDPDASPHE